jgi:hypothetical protein
MSLPIVLVAGLPGVGKTALALHVHRHFGGRIAVVAGEHMGAQDIVGLAQALANRHHHAMVLELPVEIDAADIASSLEEFRAASLRSVVAVLDAHTFLQDFCSKGLLSDRCESGPSSQSTRSLADVLTEQIELANVVVINKMDLVPVGSKPGLQALVRALNPSATILECVQGRVVPSEIMDAREFKVAHAHDSTGWALTLADTPIPNAEQHGISTLLYRARRPFHPARFAQLLSDSWPGVVRAKGVFWGFPEAVAGLSRGAIDGALFSPPHNFRMLKEGFRELVSQKDLRAMGSGFLTQGIVARKSYAASHRGVIVRLIKSTIEGVKYAIANEESTKRSIGKYLGITDPELLRQSYVYVTETFVREPFVPESTMQAMVQRMVQVNMIDAKSAQSTPVTAYFDNSYVAELKQNGFLDSIWK